MANERSSKRRKVDSSRDQILTLAIKVVAKAIKKAKTFEIQHLIRKIRQAKQGKPLKKNGSNSPDINTLESDLVALKSIQIDELSKKILYHRMKRQSIDLTNESCFQNVIALQEPRLSRMENKICSHKALADVMKQTVEKLLPQLLVQSGQSPSMLDLSCHTSDKRQNPSNLSSKKIQEGESIKAAKMRTDAKDEDVIGSELDDMVARELDALESRTEEDDSEASHEDGVFSDASTAHAQNQSSGGAYDATSPFDSKTPGQKLQHHSTKRARPSTSTFLPTLNVGYTIGDSDASDLEIDDRSLDRLERERARKNRRGQRARRAIWEQKYGKSAKHLQKLRERRQSAAPQHRQLPSHLSKSSLQKTGSNLEPIGEQRQVHPSWEAKQKQLKALSEVKPTGKKIVFD
ncbi:hypothetical protein O181_031555 [Austropuccinia psidii MF-1]|uniref:Bud22 domain-containing protein n=1 Tax=Austropuccinia psidii MF-1 TaxID=1389203 RepID=A0A9Q3CZB2_9BASI|nr:hypothetical protein [Austropuccinia psidii MF-1]